jgi:hypothetical protein
MKTHMTTTVTKGALKRCMQAVSDAYLCFSGSVHRGAATVCCVFTKEKANLVSNGSLDNSMQITLHIMFTRVCNMEH